MNAFAGFNIDGGDLIADAIYDGQGITVSLRGNADLRAREQLDDFFSSVDREAGRLKVAEVQVDLRNLVFMNSSCFKDVISWITVVQDRSSDQHYQICFLSNPSLHWQKRSLRSLACIAEDLITVKVQAV
jgi:hypothetical protein